MFTFDNTSWLTRGILAKALRGELIPTEAELARREGRTFETAAEVLARVASQAQAPVRSSQNRPGRKKKARRRSTVHAH